jgi:hypothetical protein
MANRQLAQIWQSELAQIWQSDISHRYGNQTVGTDMVIRHLAQIWQSDSWHRYGNQTFGTDMAIRQLAQIWQSDSWHRYGNQTVGTDMAITVLNIFFQRSLLLFLWRHKQERDLANCSLLWPCVHVEALHKHKSYISCVPPVLHLKCPMFDAPQLTKHCRVRRRSHKSRPFAADRYCLRRYTRSCKRA